VVSGFLIFMSYENSRSIQGYFIKRIRRIYPAYFFIILLGTVLGGFFSTYALHDYLSLPLLKYVAANLVFLNFLHPNLPGLFEGNPLQAVNGALWTLKIEVMFYIFVPLAVMAFRKFGHLTMLVTFYLCSVIYSMLMQSLAHKTGVESYLELQRQFPGQIAFFIAGAAGYYYLQYLTKYAVWLVALAVVAFALQSWLPWAAIQPLALAVLIVSVACVIPFFGNFAKYGDVSYGIYIVHFPILQTLISYGLFKEYPQMILLVSTAIVLTVALLLWHFIEKPFLRKSSHYVAASHGGSSTT
jgi:peptidoglycan/LPS O-acetylase OafA/YrhL